MKKSQNLKRSFLIGSMLFMSGVVFAQTARVDIEPPSYDLMDEIIVGYCVEYRIFGEDEWQYVYVDAFSSQMITGERVYLTAYCYLTDLIPGEYEVRVHAYYYDRDWNGYVWGLEGDIERFAIVEPQFEGENVEVFVLVYCGPLIPLNVVEQAMHPNPYAGFLNTSVLAQEFCTLKEESEME